jgi:fumarylacetoacetase
MVLDSTHDVKRRSWVESAGVSDGDFPIQNLPFGVFHRSGEDDRGGVAIGDSIVDLRALSATGLLTGRALDAARAASAPTLNGLLSLGTTAASALRAQLSTLLSVDASPEQRALSARCLVPMTGAELSLPVAVHGFTDYLCSLDHTMRMGRTTLPAAFKHLPIAYNGRPSSVRLSGEPVDRPWGQWTSEEEVRFGPETALDFELEVGAFVATGNELGRPIPIAAAGEQLYGLCLLNDWSARGIQSFESAPLGPFLGKSFSTSISPWIVTTAALAPFRVPSRRRETGDPPVPEHLDDPVDRESGAFDLTLEAFVVTPAMRAAAAAPARLTSTNFRDMYWTFAQMLAHHASNGCNLRPGDLLGSGTTSGPTDASRACLAEITRRGADPVNLPNGEQRRWLEDGDEVILRGRAMREGCVAIGFGECRAIVRPALDR